jgi:capsular polysaccharide biosynthesis protein
MRVQRTDIEPDGSFPTAKHARRAPGSAHLAAVPTNVTSHRRAASHPATVDSLGLHEFTADRADGGGSPDRGAADPEQIPNAAHVSGIDVDRVSVIWHAGRWIIASALLVGAAVYLLAGMSPPVYSSSATVSITAASTPGGSAQDVALASNSLAAQDALLVTSDSVLTAAAHQLDISPSTLASHLSSGTLNSQNLIQITAQGPSEEDAQRWAEATTTAFQAYLADRAHKTSTSLRNSITAETESLDQQIDLLQLVIDNAQNAPPGSAALTDLQSDESQLTQLVSTRATLTANTALAIASQQPVITIVVSGTAPSKVSPRPTLYATVAALLTLLVASQLAIFVARRKVRGPETP